MSVTMDIAALASAVIWPVVLLVVFLAYRSHIPGLFTGLAKRVNKLEIGGVLSFEMAKPFTPDWSDPRNPTPLDLRRQATSIQVNDSSAITFQQLAKAGTADYAEVNIGQGGEWLASRLYIMAILFARMKDLRAIVFVETADNVRKRFVGWAEPEPVRWALAAQFPWLEKAFGDAYAHALGQQHTRIVTHRGRIGATYDPDSPQPSIELFQKFLEHIQVAQPPAPHDPEEWVQLEAGMFEHSPWVTTELLEEVLGNDLRTEFVRSPDLRMRQQHDQLRIILANPGLYVAVTSEDRRFEALIDRAGVVKEAASRAITD